MYVDHVPTRPVPAMAERDRRREPCWLREERAAVGVGRYVQACREVEAARLFLLELGRRHGPMA